MIHRKKNDLLYKDITCLCHSLSSGSSALWFCSCQYLDWLCHLWVLCLVVLLLLVLRLAPLCAGVFFVVLFLLGLGLAPSSVLGCCFFQSCFRPSCSS